MKAKTKLDVQQTKDLAFTCAWVLSFFKYRREIPTFGLNENEMKQVLRGATDTFNMIKATENKP